MFSKKQGLEGQGVTILLNNFRIYGTPPSPGVYNDAKPNAAKDPAILKMLQLLNQLLVVNLLLDSDLLSQPPLGRCQFPGF